MLPPYPVALVGEMGKQLKALVGTKIDDATTRVNPRPTEQLDPPYPGFMVAPKRILRINPPCHKLRHVNDTVAPCQRHAGATRPFLCWPWRCSRCCHCRTQQVRK